MGRRRRRGALQYLILQVPDILLAGAILWALCRWAGLPAGWAVTLFVLWVLKDLAMYAVLGRTFMPPATGPEALVGTWGVTREVLAPRGYVRVGSELWLAETAHSHEVIAPETPVVVRASRGLTLLVDAASPMRSREEMGRSDEGPTR
ncbi:MAG TPA: NfeD family protein [Candidatus Methylomirabilis sp.]|nr:NfeD family protein [Candidatus Methylomirabilis sp.]